MKKKIITLAFGLAAGILPALAGPAYPGLERITLPDGSEISVRQVGDEHHHFVQTADGCPVVKGADGFFYYMALDSSGNPCAGNVRVGSPQAASFLKTADFTPVFKALSNEGNILRNKRLEKRRDRYGVEAFPLEGEVRTLVILVEYQDVKFKSETVRQDFDDMLNSDGYSREGACGSAAEWFKVNSDGKFKPTFDVFGPVTLDYPVYYYGSGANDPNAPKMVIEGCEKLDDEIDFSQYDFDNDGFVDNVFIFYAGYGEHLGSQYAETVWPHSWDIYNQTKLLLDGKYINHYACTSELEKHSKMTGMGAFVHEFSHVMGLRDHYSTAYNGAFTPGSWDVMDEGEYNNDGHTPPLYSFFELYSLGWAEPREIGLEPENVTLLPIDTKDGCIITTDNPNEFFLLENRRQEGWDEFLPYHGMLVWHIDYNPTLWSRNMVNNDPTHGCVDIVEADGTQSTATRRGDCFPGNRRKTEFTDESIPAMVTWAGKKLGKPITEITENEDGTITFKMLGGKDTSGVDTLVENGDGGVRYFNLQGIEVFNPQKGQLLIKRNGAKTEKVIF